MKENNLLEKSILATVVYYDGFDYPLTLWELRKNLADLSRFSAVKEHSDILKNVGMSEQGKPADFEISPPAGGFEILKLLETSELLKKTLSEREGFYFLASDENKNSDFYFLKGGEKSVEQRIERQKISEQNWKKAKRFAFVFRFVPFLKLVFVSGSLALNNAKRGSDVDLLLVSKSGRIWTCRFFALLPLAIFGVLRRGEKISGRFCLNHFITGESLEIKNQSLYNARTYANLIPFVVRDENVLAEFWKKNAWIKNYVAFSPPSPEMVNFRAAFRKKSFSFRPRKQTAVGDFFEKIFAVLQKRRIERDPRTFKSGGRVVADDSRLEFHPDSPEKEILEKYNEKMKRLGFPELAEERNSGLLT